MLTSLSLSVTWVIELSVSVPAASFTVIVIVSLEVDPSLDVATTVILCEVSVSWSNKVSSNTVTTPVFGSIVNLPFASSLKVYVTVSSESASVARAVIPTVSPVTAFSETSFIPVFVSEIPLISESVSPDPPVPSLSPTFIVIAFEEVVPSVDVAITVITWEVSVS